MIKVLLMKVIRSNIINPYNFNLKIKMSGNIITLPWSPYLPQLFIEHKKGAEAHAEGADQVSHIPLLNLPY